MASTSTGAQRRRFIGPPEADEGQALNIRGTSASGDPGPATLVSGAGGDNPIWERDGRRILYLDLGAPRTPGLDRTMMAVDVSLGGELRIGRATPLFGGWNYPGAIGVRSHDFLSDGSLITTLGVPERRMRNRVQHLRVVLNFDQELRDRVGR